MTTTTRKGQLIREVAIRPEQLAEARRRAAAMGSIKDSFEHGKGNVYGFLGEILFADIMGIAMTENTNTRHYDMVLNGTKIEVKAKHCTSPPRPEYDNSVAETSIKQKCDVYVFVRIMKDFSRAWILGKIRSEDFKRDAIKHKKGDIDPKSDTTPPYTFPVDCRNYEIGKLLSIRYPDSK